MSKKKEEGVPADSEKGHSKSRRKVVNSLMFGGVAAGAATTEKWTKPVVDAVLLPAHAQTSGCVVEGFTVVVTHGTTEQTFNSSGSFDSDDSSDSLNYDITVQAAGAPDGTEFDLDIISDLDVDPSSIDQNALVSGGQVNWDIEIEGFDDAGVTTFRVNPPAGCGSTEAIEVDFGNPPST